MNYPRVPWLLRRLFLLAVHPGVGDFEADHVAVLEPHELLSGVARSVYNLLELATTVPRRERKNYNIFLGPYPSRNCRPRTGGATRSLPNWHSGAKKTTIYLYQFRFSIYIISGRASTFPSSSTSPPLMTAAAKGGFQSTSMSTGWWGSWPTTGYGKSGEL